MNRRGSLEWNLETIGKLVFGAAILIMLTVLTVAIVAIFTDTEKTWRAYRNLELLERKIELHKDETSWSDSIILQMPDKYVLLGFGDKTVVGGARAGKDTIQLQHIEGTGSPFTAIEKPRFCGDVCICAFLVTDDDNAPVKKVACKELDIDSTVDLRGMDKTITSSYSGFNIELESVDNGKVLAQIADEKKDTWYNSWFGLLPKHTTVEATRWYPFMLGQKPTPVVLAMTRVQHKGPQESDLLLFIPIPQST